MQAAMPHAMACMLSLTRWLCQDLSINVSLCLSRSVAVMNSYDDKALAPELFMHFTCGLRVTSFQVCTSAAEVQLCAALCPCPMMSNQSRLKARAWRACSC